MKWMVILSLLSLSTVILASPVPEAKEYRWTMIPDSEGAMHLVDLNSFEEPIEPNYDAETDAFFILFTRANPAGEIIHLENLASIQGSNFNGAHETRFTIHGWGGGGMESFNRNVAAQYHQRGEYNIISVDWSAGAGSPNYITARNRVPETAAVVARFIDFLHLHNLATFNRVHVIGFSLGGQVAGLTGKAVTRGLIHVIVALDPAGPLFSLDDPNGRVAPTDGAYVEVIVTNGGLLGFLEPIGQVNIYPNFGRAQPGCGIDISGQCAHSRAHQLFAESINTIFTTHECSSFEEIANGQCTRTGRTTRMGGPSGNHGMSGNFYVTTNLSPPWSQG